MCPRAAALFSVLEPVCFAKRGHTSRKHSQWGDTCSLVSFFAPNRSMGIPYRTMRCVTVFLLLGCGAIAADPIDSYQTLSMLCSLLPNATNSFGKWIGRGRVGARRGARAGKSGCLLRLFLGEWPWRISTTLFCLRSIVTRQTCRIETLIFIYIACENNFNLCHITPRGF